MPTKFRSSATAIPIEEAVGTVLAHDMTEIRPGQFKGMAFKKGHLVKENDLPHLQFDYRPHAAGDALSGK
jgi:hypothetical protein